MKTFAQYVTELFNQPFRFTGTNEAKRRPGYWPRATESYHYTNGTDLLDVGFTPVTIDGEHWEVAFVRNGTTSLTGGGAASSVFASVLDAVKRFVREHSPEVLSFSAAKSELDARTLLLRSGTRVRLYHSMIKRFAPGLGYELWNDPDRDPLAHKEDFILRRKR